MSEQTPRSIQALLQEALTHHRDNKYDEAERLYRQVLDINPNEADANHLLGVLVHKKGDFEEAVKLIKKAIELSPQQAQYHLNLGLAHKETGHYQEAKDYYRNSLELDPRLIDGYAYLGNLHKRLNEHQDAIRCYQQAIKLGANKKDMFLSLGQCLVACKLWDAAIQSFKKVLSFTPDDVEALVEIAKVYIECEEYAEARKCLTRAHELQPENVYAIEQMAILAHKDKQPELAMEMFAKAIDIEPNNPHFHHNLGVAYFEKGNLDDASPRLEKAIELKPDFAQAYFTYSQVKKFKKRDPYFIALESLLAEASLSNEDKIECHFALGKMYQDCGDYNKAFVNYKAGNQLKQFKYDGEKQKTLVKRMKSVFTFEFFEKMQGISDSEYAPIFIVGMPRSGTTLIEQILSSHPLVSAGGELKTMSHMSQFLENKKNPDQQYPEIMNVVGMPIIKQMVSYYEEQTERFLIDGAVHITDKMPFNFFHLGMISVIFPKATIIHCHRHPAATITSIYSQNFRIPQPFGSELESMGEYYQLYQDMMTYWESVLPINVYDVEYEDLVAHPKRVIMEMVEHCHLPWDEACLKYHENDNHVRTASIWQVRQPMYKSSLAKWKKFKKHLGPIKHLI